MMKIKTARLKIDIDLYGVSVNVYVGALDWFNVMLKNDFPQLTFSVTEKDMEHYAARVFDCGSIVIIYAMKNIPLKVMLHELCHAAFILLRTAGIPLTKDNEAYAYLYDYMAEKACRWYGLDTKRLIIKQQ